MITSSQDTDHRDTATVVSAVAPWSGKPSTFGRGPPLLRVSQTRSGSQHVTFAAIQGIYVSGSRYCISPGTP